MSAPFMNARDRAYAESVADGRLRETITHSVTQYRRSDQLSVGDALPPLALTRLTDEAAARLDELGAGKLLVLIFGSYT